MLKGTKLETTLTGGRLPFQFKFALQEVLKARVAVEGCTISAAQHEQFFGLNVQNIIRLLDPADTTLASLPLPATCDTPFSFNWKKLKEGFAGVVLPSTCTSAGFASSKRCNVKFKLFDNFFIELAINDNCVNQVQNGYGLPSINVFCSGTLCDSFAKPCVTNSDCTGGSTCDAIADSHLANALQPLIDMSLFNNMTDFAGCSSGGNSFPEKFWSGIINSGAYLAGLTNTVSSAVYSDVKLCGISNFATKFIPTEAPTPIPTFRCFNSTILPVSQVCDSVPDCQNGEDEQSCGCGVGMLSSSGQCCSVCPTGNEPYCSSQFCGSASYSSGSSNFISVACPPTPSGTPVSCPDFLMSSTSPVPQVIGATLKSVAPANAAQHIIGWADCEGNVQMGSPSELAVFNGHLPFQNVAAEIERVIKSLEICRIGTAPSPTQWARLFFPWSVNLWGGLFYSDASALDIFGSVNPGAKLDETIRYYSAADNYTFVPPDYNTKVYAMSPPFANVANAPASCDLASTTGTGSCELAATIGSWFAGPSFPAGWSGATTLKAKLASTCSTTSMPNAFLTCEGACDATSKSGCCIMRNAFTAQTGPGVCPTGYKLVAVQGGVTDFLFRNRTTAKSNDTTLQNFVSLVIGRQIAFGAQQAPFTDVYASEAARSFCLIDGNEFGNNTNLWGKTAAGEDCPVPALPPNGTLGCPQFLSGGLGGCSGASCLGAPITSQCNPQCPLPPTPSFITNPAVVSGPIFGLVAVLGLLALS